MKRHLGLVVGGVAAAAAVALSSCSAVSPDAATVGSTHISQRDFERDLHALITNEGFKQQFQGIATAARDGAVTANLTRVLLNLEIRQELVHQVAALTSISIGPPAEADAVAASYGFTAESWAALPAGFRNRLATAAAEQEAVQNKLNGAGPDDNAVSAFYEQNKDQVGGRTLEEIRPQIVQELKRQTNWDKPFEDAMAEASSKTNIRVDPRYGAWDPRGIVTKSEPPTAGADAPGVATTQP